MKDFYEYLLNRTRIHFLPKYAPPDEENSFTLDLSKRMTYDQFASKVGERLGVDPTHLRFTTVHAASGKPKAPVRRATINVLAHIMSSTLNYSNTRDQKSDALFYEVLEMSLSELETRKNVKLTWLSEGITKEVLSTSLSSISDSVC